MGRILGSFANGAEARKIGAPTARAATPAGAVSSREGRLASAPGAFEERDIASGRDVRVRWVDLRCPLNSNLLEDRHQPGGECIERLLRFPNVDDPKAFLSLPWDVGEQARDRPVGGRFHPLLAPGELAHGLLVLLLRHTLEDENDWHRYLLALGNCASIVRYGLLRSVEIAPRLDELLRAGVEMRRRSSSTSPGCCPPRSSAWVVVPPRLDCLRRCSFRPPQAERTSGSVRRAPGEHDSAFEQTQLGRLASCSLERRLCKRLCVPTGDVVS